MFGLGSQSQLGIGIALSLHDNFSAQAAKINQQLIQMRKQSTSALGAAVTDYRNRAAGIAAASAALTYGMYNMAEQGAKFQHTINQVAIVGGKDLGRTRAQLTAFANQLSQTFARDPQEIAETLFENVKAGVTKGLTEITKYQLAVAASTDEALSGPGGVGEKLLGTMNAFGLKMGDVYEAGGQKMSQFARVANGVTAAANATMASVNNIGEAMQYFGASASQSNISLEQALTLIGKLSQSKIQGSSAGTALMNMTQQLMNTVGPLASKKKLTAIRMLGIDPNHLRGMIDHGHMYDALELVDAQSRKLGIAERGSILNRIFNNRGGRGIANAFLGGDKSLSSIRSEIEKGIVGDVAIKQSKAMTNDLYSDMNKLHAAFTTLKADVARALGPSLRTVLGWLGGVTRVLGAILKTPVGSVLANLALVATSVVGVMFAFRAALLTTTIALRGFAGASSVGGFGSLFRGSLGMIGNAGMGGLGGQISKNASGRWMVNAGQTITHGGKIYKGGQLLPSSFLTGIGLAGSGGAAGVGSKLAGYLGKAAPFLGRAMGFMGELLPVVGWVIAGVTVTQAIYDLFKKSEAKKDKAPLDPVFQAYYRNLDNQVLGTFMSKDWYNKSQQARADQLHLNQNLILNVDGVGAMNQNLQKSVALTQFNQVASQFNVELPEGE
jgi:TP901 family phage tail tape measure protein